MKATYKNDKMRIEDALIPALLERLMLTHLTWLPDEYKDTYDIALSLLRPEIEREINGNVKLGKRLHRILNLIREYFDKQDWGIPKSHMVVSILGDILHCEQMVILGKGTQQVIKDISELIVENYYDDEIKKQDESAIKQAPKLLKFIQQHGYFN